MAGAGDGYLPSRQQEIEGLLSELVSELISAEPTDIVGHMCDCLHRRKERIHTQKAEAIAAALARSAPPSAPTPRDEGDGWSVASWLGARAAEPVAAALLRPLGAQGGAERSLSFMRELSRDRQLVRALLDARVLDALAELVCRAAAELSSERGSAAALSQKFAASTFTLAFGGLDVFFSGLEGRIGPPNPDLRAAMAREHCDAADALEPFTTSNYGITTTSAFEWWYVVAPHEIGGRLAELGVAEAPEERRGAEEATRRKGAAAARPLGSFAAELHQVNMRLLKLGEVQLLMDEVLAGRLYTGPLFHKYNLVLRGGKGAAPLLRRELEGTCRGNQYVTTLHVLNSCIVKLSKLTVVSKVYRGLANGVLPEPFWRADAYGVRGGVELAFMSTTTDRRVAEMYASEGAAGLVLELQQGMCNRGAELSFLSQYPHEKEVLFAPLTGVELRRTRVDGARIVAEMEVSVNLASPTIEQVVSKLRASHAQLLALQIERLRAAHAPQHAVLELEGLLFTARMREPEHFNSPANYQAATNEALRAQRDALASLGAAAAWASEGAPAAAGGRREGAAAQPAALRALAGGAGLSARMLKCAALCTETADLETAAALLLLAHDAAAAEAAAEAEGAEAVERAVSAGGGGAEVRRRMYAALPVVLQGAVPPWPPALVKLCEDEPSAAAFAALVEPMVRRRLFEPGAAVHVLCLTEEEEAAGASHFQRKWRKATILQRHGEAEFDVSVARRRRPMRTSHARGLLHVSAGGAAAILRAAAAAGHEGLVGALLRAHASPHEADEQCAAPLHFAAAAAHARVCALLLGARADGFVPDARGRRAFDAAQARSHVRVRRVLCPSASDADVAAMDAASDALPPLLRAARDGAEEAVRAALGGGAEVDARGAAGLSALMLAARGGHGACVAALLAAAASVGAASASGATALSLAAEEGHAAVVRALAAAAAPLEARDAHELSALMRASENGHAAAAAALLEAAADPNATGRNGAALRLAARHDHLEVVALLLAQPSIRVDQRRADGSTALMSAAHTGHEEVVRQLLAAGADVMAESSYAGEEGTTPHMYAAACGHEKVLKLLLGARASLHHARRKDGRNALHLSCAKGHVSTTATLLHQGADPLALTAGGATALHLASEAAHLAPMSLLLALPSGSGALGMLDGNGFSPLHLACLCGDEACVRALLAASAAVDTVVRPPPHGQQPAGSRDGRFAGRTALEIAEALGHQPIVDLMIVMNAPPVDI
ncbi:hypothetical protein AB1Y20_018129 [Prymnesium parvum]|uniref:NAD(P)(+)--arginine ADP-ribosyltransferase n=1 Tax=Prymnesium parvum TaxID=97485 RepID=A0AB34JNF0_PRYPA